MINFRFSDDLVDKYLTFSKEYFTFTKEQMEQIMELLVVWKSALE